VPFAVTEQLRDLLELGFLELVFDRERNVLDRRVRVNRRFLLLRWLEAAPFFLISVPIVTSVVKRRLTTTPEHFSQGSLAYNDQPGLPSSAPWISLFTKYQRNHRIQRPV